MYVYTSGTTGLPKPAVIKQNRYYGASFVFFATAGLTSKDRIYVTLPIYHGNGNFLKKTVVVKYLKYLNFFR